MAGVQDSFVIILRALVQAVATCLAVPHLKDNTETLLLKRDEIEGHSAVDGRSVQAHEDITNGCFLGSVLISMSFSCCAAPGGGEDLICLIHRQRCQFDKRVANPQ